MKVEMDTSTWPERATLAKWGRLANVSTTTLTKYSRLGLLPGKRLKVGNALSISKATVMKAFNITPTPDY
jgi:hypothetical protein